MTPEEIIARVVVAMREHGLDLTCTCGLEPIPNPRARCTACRTKDAVKNALTPIVLEREDARDALRDIAVLAAAEVGNPDRHLLVSRDAFLRIETLATEALS